MTTQAMNIFKEDFDKKGYASPLDVLSPQDALALRKNFDRVQNEIGESGLPQGSLGA